MEEKDIIRKAAMEKQRRELYLENQRKREETEARLASSSKLRHML